MRPGIVAAFIFHFVTCWNELFLPVTPMNSDAGKTVLTVLNGFVSSFDIDRGSMSAVAVLTILPTTILFAFAGRHTVQGLTSDAAKGLSGRAGRREGAVPDPARSSPAGRAGTRRPPA
ncbi:ABC transporter permease family protein [Streptomyces hirsutus]|uniref:hypothetical protein n=1 Tax=Streptomyces hirsutus TaxID=35620 RepID=UPI0036960FC2